MKEPKPVRKSKPAAPKLPPLAKLLLLDFGGIRYGVRADTVPSITTALALHRLPLSPAVFAGITLLEGRSASIADLGACLGRPPLSNPRAGTFLIVDPEEKVAGFCVGGSIATFECPAEKILPLPPDVATPVADSCAIYGAALIPIINLHNLLDRLKQGQLDLPTPQPPEFVPSAAFSEIRRARIVARGNAQFCVDAADTAFAPLEIGAVAPLPVHSQRLAGITLHEGEIVPVLLADELLGGSSNARHGILLVGPPGRRFGLVVDQELGLIEGAQLSLLPLPKLVDKPWLAGAALAKGEIYLLVDCNRLVAPDELVQDELEAVSFTPTSRFAQEFRRNDAAINEFSLLGARHAVPQEELKDNLALLRFVPVPGTPEIVLGVAELRGELLPVLDLAAIFGRRSPLGKSSRMMHIVNGDFQALVVTNDVAEGRFLPLATQRQLPIALPYEVLYGCYLDAELVGLILNVEALAVHFEKMAVRELVSSLSPELLETPSPELELAVEIGSAEESPVAIFEPEEQIEPETPPENPTAEQGSLSTVAEPLPQPTEEEPSPPTVAAVAPPAPEEIPTPTPTPTETETKTETATAAAAAAANTRTDEDRRRFEDEARVLAAEQAEQTRLQAEAQSIEAARAQERADRLKAEAATLARAEAEEAARAREEERSLAEEAARIRAADEACRREAQAAQQLAAEAARQREAHALQQAEEELRIAADEAEKRADDEAQQRAAADERNVRDALTSSSIPLEAAEPNFAPEPQFEEPSPASPKSGKVLGIATLIAVLLVLIVFMSLPERPIPSKTTLPNNTEKPGAPQQSVPQQSVPQQSATQQPSPPQDTPQTEKKAALYLAVPPSTALVEPFIYKVVEGDNLWNIAKRFTGDPFNYPRVAKDNSIATPDLIVPGQKIQIRQQTAVPAGD